MRQPLVRSNALRGTFFRPRIKSPRLRYSLLAAAVITLAPVYYGLAFGRLVVNGTDSLEANAFVMVTWPKPLWRGSVVALEMPEPLRKGLDLDEGQAVLVKRVVGIPGDRVQHSRDGLCVGHACLVAHPRSDGSGLDLWAGDVVPTDAVFVVGESATSLDSRYAAIGPRPVDDILAVGFPVRFPNWRALRVMLDGGGG